MKPRSEWYYIKEFAKAMGLQMFVKFPALGVTFVICVVMLVRHYMRS